MAPKGQAQSMADIAARSTAPSPAIPVDYSSADYWAALAETMKGGDGKYIYVKGEETVLRLIPAPGGEHPFQQGTGYYKGDVKMKQLFYAVQLTKGGSPDDAEIKVAVAAPSIVRQIVGLLQEGYDLFDPIQGVPVKVKNGGGGKGNGVSYTVLTLPKAKPLPAHIIEQLGELDLLSDKVREFDADQFTRNGSSEGKKDEDDY